VVIRTGKLSENKKFTKEIFIFFRFLPYLSKLSQPFSLEENAREHRKILFNSCPHNVNSMEIARISCKLIFQHNANQLTKHTDLINTSGILINNSKKEFYFLFINPLPTTWKTFLLSPITTPTLQNPPIMTALSALISCASLPKLPVATICA